jgi:HEPN/RES N-terminal domain 1/RES domain
MLGDNANRSNDVSYTKRMMEEEEARGYETSSDAICVECFDDPGIVRFIEDHLQSKTCSLCGQTSGENIAAPADEVLQFFLEKIYEHYEDANESAPYDGGEGGFQVHTYSMYDLVFHENSDIAPCETLEWFYNRLKNDIVFCDRDWQIMTPGQALEIGWSSFANSVKHTSRFLFFPKSVDEDESGEPFLVRPEEMLEQLGEVIRDCGLIRKIPAGTKLFRARGHDAGTTYTFAKDLGPPPVELAKTAGRMNAPGIVAFYGAQEKNTALAEATGKHTMFSVAEFETLTDLPVVDLTDLPRVPSIFESGPRESLRFLRHFTQEVSQPFEPDAEIHIEYTPTQIVSEFFRHRLHDDQGKPIRGVVYGSAKCEGTSNVALFMESSEVEGVPTESWKKKESILRLVSIEEAKAPESH